MDENDVIVVMEAAQLSLLRSRFPHRREHLFLLSLLDQQSVGAYERLNIRDPFGQPKGVFELCYQRVDRAVARLVEEISLREH
jgi:protein-tyrosine-phosphatase